MQETKNQNEAMTLLHVGIQQDEFRPEANPDWLQKWTQLLNATAYASRFIAGKNRRKGDIKKDELDAAELELLHEAQRDFEAEKRLVVDKRQQEISRKSELHGLNVFIDKKGLLRLQTRNLHATDISYDTKLSSTMLTRKYPNGDE